MPLTPPKLGTVPSDQSARPFAVGRNMADWVPERPQSHKPSTTPPRKQLVNQELLKRRVGPRAEIAPAARQNRGCPVPFPQRPPPLLERQPRRSTIRRHRKVINPLVDLIEHQDSENDVRIASIESFDSMARFRRSSESNDSRESLVADGSGDASLAEELAVQQLASISKLVQNMDAAQIQDTDKAMREILDENDAGPIAEILRSAQRQRPRPATRRHSASLEVRLELEAAPTESTGTVETLMENIASSTAPRSRRWAEAGGIDIWRHGPPPRHARRSLGDEELRLNERARTALSSLNHTERELLEFLLALKPVVAPGARLVSFLGHVDIRKVKSLLPLKKVFAKQQAEALNQAVQLPAETCQPSGEVTAPAAENESPQLTPIIATKLSPDLIGAARILAQVRFTENAALGKAEYQICRGFLKLLGIGPAATFIPNLRIALRAVDFPGRLLVPTLRLPWRPLEPKFQALQNVVGALECSSEPAINSCNGIHDYLQARQKLARRRQEHSSLSLSSWEQIPAAWFAAIPARTDKIECPALPCPSGDYASLYAKTYDILLKENRKIWANMAKLKSPVDETQLRHGIESGRFDVRFSAHRRQDAQRNFLKVANGEDYHAWLGVDAGSLSVADPSTAHNIEISPLSKCHRWSLEPQRITVHEATMTNLRRSSMWTVPATPASNASFGVGRQIPSLEELMRVPFTPVATLQKASGIPRETPLPSKK